MSESLSGGGSKTNDEDVSPAKVMRVEAVPDSAEKISIVLKNGRITIPLAYAVQSGVLAHALGAKPSGSMEDQSGSDDEDEDAGGGGAAMREVPFPNMTVEDMTTVVKYMKHHKDHPVTVIPQTVPGTDLKAFVTDPFDLALVLHDEAVEDIPAYLDRISAGMIAADFLNMQPLVHLYASALAVRLRGASRAKVMENFGLDPETTFTQEEEDTILAENPWLASGGM